MNASSQTWIVVADDPAVSGLVVAARTLSAEVTAVVAGRRETAESVAAAGVDRVLWLGEPSTDPGAASATVLATSGAYASTGVPSAGSPSHRTRSTPAAATDSAVSRLPATTAVTSALRVRAATTSPLTAGSSATTIHVWDEAFMASLFFRWSQDAGNRSYRTLAARNALTSSAAAAVGSDPSMMTRCRFPAAGRDVLTAVRVTCAEGTSSVSRDS